MILRPHPFRGEAGLVLVTLFGRRLLVPENGSVGQNAYSHPYEGHEGDREPGLRRMLPSARADVGICDDRKRSRND